MWFNCLFTHDLCFIIRIFFWWFVGLTSVIVADIIGMDKLSNGLGLLYLFQGVVTFLGTPIVGKKKSFVFS